MNANRILIVGCGNIGSRHLQSLLESKKIFHIDIVEPSKKSRKLAELIISQKPLKVKHQIFWHNNLEKIKHKTKLVIISTLAPNRVFLINELLKLGHSRFLIEKMVCQSKQEYDFLMSQMNLYSAKAWVNCPRRYFSSYQKIKKTIQNTKNLHVNVHSGNIGLGSNAIHFLDLFSWFIDDNKIKLNGEFLDKKIFFNKRGKNLVEFQGTIFGHYKSNILSIHFSPFGEMPQTVDISGKNIRIQINESLDKITILKGKKNILKFKTEFQSKLTIKMVDDIIKKDFSLLPTIQDSYFIHCQLFQIFNSHLKKILKKKVKLCPIT